jgi:hypothetical protein
VITSIVIGAGAVLALAVNIGQSAIFTALSSLCIAMLYLAYLGVTAPLLAQRFRLRGAGFPPGVDEDGRPLFSLGRWGIPVNILAVLFQAVMVVNLAWPRAEIYDLTGGSWWLQYSAILFIVGVLVVGAAYHLYSRRRHGRIVLTEVPTSHVIASAPSAVIS